jgi:hypothetical protein
MTWFRHYGIKQDLQEGIIEIPTNKGKSVLLQAHSQIKEEPTLSQIYTLNIRLNHEIVYQDKENDIIGITNDNPKEPLHDYSDEITSITENSNRVLSEPVRALLEKYDQCFAENAGLGRVSPKFAHTIELENPNVSIRTKPYRLTWEEDEHLKQEITDMINNGLIRPSQGKWTSPVFFVSKKDKGLRLVVDFRKLNQNTKKTAFPLPHINELLDSFGGATVFSTLDAASGYWQVPLAEESIEKTGFITKMGTYEFLVMPFGLATATDTYQRMMTSLLSPYIGKFILVFIDDIIVFSKNHEEHLEHLEKVFKICSAANLKLKRAKCYFLQDKVEYLGHVVSKNGIAPNGRNVSKILEMRAPETVAEVRSLLGTTNYYRRFIPHYAELMEPITKLLKKNHKFNWGNNQKESLSKVKLAMTNPPLLTYPDKNQVQILTTDASGVGLGAILSQSPNGSENDEKVIAYASKSLNEGQRKWAAVHSEAYAIIWGVKYFRHYLAGSRKFILYTDNSAVKFILDNEKANPKVSRWSAALMEYNFTIKHRPGKRNPADALSRFI